MSEDIDLTPKALPLAYERKTCKISDLPSWGLSEIEPAKNQRLHPNWFVRYYTLNQHNSVYAAEQILLHSIDHLNHDWRLENADYEVMLPNGTKATIHRRMMMFRKRGD